MNGVVLPKCCNFCAEFAITGTGDFVKSIGVGTKSVVCALNRKLVLVPELGKTKLCQLEEITVPKKCPLRVAEKEPSRV
jgi:hypothetical protein